MQILLLALVLMAVVWYLPKNIRAVDTDFRTRAIKYSGLQPDLYYTFVNEMEIYKRSPDVDTGSRHLYKALEALEELALYVKGGSTSVSEEIWELIHDIADHEEAQILKNALENGVRFAPKYLKEYPLIQ